MPAGNERKALLRIADRLYIDLGYSRALGSGAVAPAPRGSHLAGFLGPEDEELVIAMSRALAKLAEAVGMDAPEKLGDSGVGAALEGAELVMRGELAVGGAARLPDLVPGFVFLVTLPIVEQDEALELSLRTSEIVSRAIDGRGP